MAPLPTTSQSPPSNPLNGILTHLPKIKRSSNCEYYDTSCGTHRTVILIIIILVGAFVGLILSLVYMRGRQRRIAREKAARVASQQRKLSAPFQGVTYEAPPPYMPRAPENAAKRDLRAL
ncbi:hypothetical protein BKA66DRAFT_564535 [Pyrenochaeta sp. MPI-SDFR-AT-0127]|nr:hypothetical protein BKA66DRAFT_564535 [Pyrenochaeta sp. MPI-SDFR-AT-0127]